MLGEEFREKAGELRKAANALFEDASFDVKPKMQAMAIIGHVHATTLEALADLADVLAFGNSNDKKMQRRKKIMEDNNALRQAAARGDWDTFDEIAERIGGNATNT